MKKSLKIAGLFLFSVIISAIIVSADMDFSSASNKIVQTFQDIFGPFFLGLIGSGDLLFERILILFVVVAVSYISLKRVPMFDDHRGALILVCVCLGLLGARYLTNAEIIKNIMFSQGLLQVVLTSALPLIVFFFFTESFESGAARKILWILFLVTFVGIWWTKTEAGSLGEFSWIYMTTAIIALVFLLADGTIRRFMQNEQIKQLGYQNRDEFIRKVRNQLYDLEQDYHVKKSVTYWQYKDIKRRLEKQLKSLLRH